MRLEDPAIAHALPVTSNATQSRASRLCANSTSGPDLDPTPRTKAAFGDDRHLAEITMDIQRYRSHPVLLADAEHGENRWAKRHRRIRARSATRQVAGAATEKARAQAHRAKRPAQPAFSQKAPVPVNRTYAGHRITRPPSKRSFMPRKEHSPSTRLSALGSRESGTVAIRANGRRSPVARPVCPGAELDLR
jgi:hypothetical protein